MVVVVDDVDGGSVGSVEHWPQLEACEAGRLPRRVLVEGAGEVTHPSRLGEVEEVRWSPLQWKNNKMVEVVSLDPRPR